MAGAFRRVVHIFLGYDAVDHIRNFMLEGLDVSKREVLDVLEAPLMGEAKNYEPIGQFGLGITVETSMWWTDCQ
jgi:hypothetical protein